MTASTLDAVGVSPAGYALAEGVIAYEPGAIQIEGFRQISAASPCKGQSRLSIISSVITRYPAPTCSRESCLVESLRFERHRHLSPSSVHSQ